MNVKEAAAVIRDGATKEQLQALLEKSRGGGYVCPICGAGKKSGCVSVFDDARFYCNACQNDKLNGEQGSIIDAYMLRYGFSFRQAVEELARGYGVTIDEERRAASKAAPPSVKQKLPKKDDSMQEKPKQDFSEYLKTVRENINAQAKKYLRARGITSKTAARLGLGYDSAWINPKGGKIASPRIICPFSGGVGYLARALNDSNGCKQNGGSVGLFNAEALQGGGVVFVTEGCFDAASIEETKRKAVALNGKGNARILVKAAEDFDGVFVIALDADEAGREGTEALKKALDEIGALYVVADCCGPCKDENEFLCSDPAAFDYALQVAEDAARELLEKDAAPDALSEYINGGGFSADTTAGVCMKSGFSALDAWLDDGFFAGRLYVVAGRTGAGKSAFMWQVGENIASAGGYVLYFSLELSRAEILARAIVRRAYQRGRNIRVNAVLKGAPVDDEIAELLSSVGNRLSVIDGGYGESVAKIREYVKRFRRRNKGPLAVFVDYLQAAADGEGKAENVAISDAAKQLKQLSKDFQCVVLTASSMARTTYNESASFSSFYGSCNVEYSADGVFALQYAVIDSPAWNTFPSSMKEAERKAARAKMLDKAEEENPRKLCLIGLKNRGNSPHKRIPMLFDAAHFYMKEGGAASKASAPKNSLSVGDVEDLINFGG